jgi:hypothetical protein
MGNLYNKESILKGLIDKSLNPSFSFIRNMKDVKTLIFHPNPNYSIEKESEGEYTPMFMCPITKIELNGIHPFVVIWSTGFVISEKAIKTLGFDGLQDYGPFTEDDIIRLLPSTAEEIDNQVRKMVHRRNNAKLLKKKTKEENKEVGLSDEVDDNNKNKKRKHEEKDNDNKNNIPEKLTTKISHASNLVKSAADQIKQQESNSNVFKNLFHKDHEKDRHDKDLFMTVAGIRYNLN